MQSGNRLISDFYVLQGPGLESQTAKVRPTAGRAVLPPRCVVLVAAQKTSAATPGWPMQTKYLNNPNLAS